MFSPSQTNMTPNRITLVAALTAAITTAACSSTDQQPEKATGGMEPEVAVVATIDASWRSVPLGASVEKGLDFLISAQGEDGGFGQDGRDPRTGVALESEGRDVANTAMVALAMLRAGTTPSDGRYTDQLLAAVDFIASHVEKAPAEGLAITDRQNTQVQRKLGPYVDTFLAAMLLSELKGQMPDERTEKRVGSALEKCVDKIEKNQQADGSWNSGGGWAPVISTSLASRSLAEARKKGVEVDDDVLLRVDTYTKDQFDGKQGAFKPSGADAGVALYSVAQAFEQASRTEESVEENKELLEKAGQMLDSASFQSGFGSMGGEEFISYMNISDSLRRQGGEKWQSWNRDIVERLTKLQNQDGSWAGHHCITGRVACTSAAIMTILAERVGPKPAGD